MHDQSSRATLGCLFALTVFCLVPIWAFKYFPTTDGASHLENAYTLLHLGDEDRDFRHYYDLSLEPNPNWFSHLALAVLMTVLPPLFAEKVLLTGYLVFFILAMLYYLRSVNRESGFYTLLAAPFMYNYTLQMGFYNFTFSIPFMFAVLGFWWRRRERPVTLGSAIVLNALLILLFFFHLVSLVLTVAIVVGFAAILHRKNPRRTLSLVASLAPSFVLPAHYVLSRGAEVLGDYHFGDFAAFLRLDLLVSHHPDTRYVGAALAIVFAVLILVTLLWDRMRLPLGLTRIRLEERDLFLLAALVITAAYVLSPPGIARGAFLHERLAIYPFLLVLPWLTTRLARPFRYSIAAVAVLLTASHLTLLTERIAILNHLLEEYTSGIAEVGKNDVILPLCFDQKELEDTRICTFLHATGYYCIETGAIELSNYEANSRHFPLSSYTSEMNPIPRVLETEHRPGAVRPEAHPEPIDFILIWHLRGDFPKLSWIREHYDVAHEQGRLTLLKRKT